MRESDVDLAELDALLDRSRAAAGAHLRGIFDEEHAVPARGLADALVGIFEMHLATVTPAGAPLVAPVDGIFLRGSVWFGLPGESVRARLVRREPRVSASYTRGNFAFIVHGTALEVDAADDGAAEYRDLVCELYVALYGSGWINWYEEQQRAGRAGDSFTGRIEPRVMFAKR